MQIKPIIAAAVAIACIFLGWPAIAAGAPNPSGAAVNHDRESAAAGDTFVSQATIEEESIPTTEIAPTANPGEQTIPTTAKPVENVVIQSGRPRVERHRDARACLAAGNNVAIIKCAEKFRYR